MSKPMWVVIAWLRDTGLTVEVRQERPGEIAQWDDEDEPDDWGDDDLFMRASANDEKTARDLATMMRTTFGNRSGRNS